MEHFKLRWTSHQETTQTIFNELLKTETLVDVTLYCLPSMRFVKAHQVILAASSPFFQNVLAQSSCNERHPIIFLNEVKYSELTAIINYIYTGEATIPQDQLPSILKVAESLRIRGLFNQDQEKENEVVQAPPSNPGLGPPLPQEQSIEEDEEELINEEEHCDETDFYDVDDFDESEFPKVKAELNESEEDRTSSSSAGHQYHLNFNSLPQYSQDEGNSSEKESYECKCGKKYTSNKSLWRHRKFACEGKQSFECGICQKIFSRSDNLRRHAVVAHCAT